MGTYMLGSPKTAGDGSTPGQDVSVKQASVRVVMAAYSSEDGPLVSHVVFDLDDQFEARIGRLSRLCQNDGIQGVLAAGEPKGWLPVGVADEGSFSNEQVEVRENGFWFSAMAESHDVEVSSRWTSKEELRSLATLHAGKTVLLETQEAKVLGDGQITLEAIASLLKVGE